MKKILLICLLIFILTLSSGFNPVFSKNYKFFGIEETMKFENYTFKMISDNGDWLIYGLKPDRGDSRAVILSTRNETKYEVARASMATTSEIGNYVALKVEPDYLQKEQLKKDELKDTLFILNTANGDISKIPNISNFEISNDGVWLYYILQDGKDDSKDGNKVYLKHLESNSDIFIQNVNHITFDSTSSYLIYSKNSENKSNNGFYYRDLKTSFAPEIIIQKDTNYVFEDFQHNIDFDKVIFKLAKLDSNNKAYKYQLNIYDFFTKEINPATKSDEFDGWYIPKNSKLKWTDAGLRLFYGVKPLSEYIPEDKDSKNKFNAENYYDLNKILADADLYLWHNNDNKINTQKRTEWKNTKNKTYSAIYHLKGNNNVRLGDLDLPEVEYTENNIYTIAYDPTPYEKLITYDGWYFDLYYIDLFTGEKTLIEKELYSNAYISDFFPHVTYFKDKHWYFYDITQNYRKNITETLKNTKFYDELHDTPQKPMPYGAAGWGEECKTFVIYDRYDVWEILLPSCTLINLNQGAGRLDNVTMRIVNLAHDIKYIDHKVSVFVTAFNNNDKSNYIIHLKDRAEFYKIQDSLYWSYELKAKYSNDIIVSRKSYNVFPDLYLTNEKLEKPKKLTNIHPEIEEYNWGYTEMVKYTNSKGDTLQGFVIKPNNFDPKKKYPLLVYFYERFSQLRHQFTAPRILHRPIYQWYISQGYCMFFPDIKFYDGKPGDSGLDAVVSGCQSLIDEGYIDKDKIALHGHSWSGYQSAYFITQTDFFKACVSGAPVSNMTSAYSGIRLGSGLARQFQYEKAQSRIGGNLIDSLDAYISNSPVFFADKINTPLLIMFGDIDDAVPWQQGIELYLACRRYNKDCIMLQYENEPHHLKKYANKLDYTIKMKQFFDHYVLGKEPAKWITEGVEYKGKPQTMEVEKP